MKCIYRDIFKLIVDEVINELAKKDKNLHLFYIFILLTLNILNIF